MSSFGPCLKSRFDSFQSPSQYYGSPITITTTSPWPTSTTPSSSTPAAAAAGTDSSWQIYGNGTSGSPGD